MLNYFTFGRFLEVSQLPRFLPLPLFSLQEMRMITVSKKCLQIRQPQRKEYIGILFFFKEIETAMEV